MHKKTVGCKVQHTLCVHNNSTQLLVGSQSCGELQHIISGCHTLILLRLNVDEKIDQASVV